MTQNSEQDYWKENGIKKPQQIVVCAACRDDKGLIFLGARHWDRVMVAQAKAAGYTDKMPIPHDDGFINQFGEFLTREDAMEIVKKNGQPFNKERNGGGDTVLYSEGLY